MNVEKPKQISIWHYVVAGKGGHIFKLLPKGSADAAHHSQISNSIADFDGKSAVSPRAILPIEATI